MKSQRQSMQSIQGGPNIVKDHIIIGSGPNTFRILCFDEKNTYKEFDNSCSSHPHNTYVQILSETGIIGFLFLLTALIYFSKNLVKHLILKIRGNPYFTDFEICVLSGIAIYLWPIIPTGNIFNNWLNIVMILNLPFIIWSVNTTRAQKS